MKNEVKNVYFVLQPQGYADFIPPRSLPAGTTTPPWQGESLKKLCKNVKFCYNPAGCAREGLEWKATANVT